MGWLFSVYVYEYILSVVPLKAVLYCVKPALAGPDIFEPVELKKELCAGQTN